MKKLTFILIALLAIGILKAGNNTSTVNQFGVNVATVLQIGEFNGALIQQGFLGAFVTNNYQPVHPNDWIEGSYIVQTGKYNTASSTVHTSNNGTSIFQLGNSNTATQDVGSFYEETKSITKMGLDIDQIGNGNLANQQTFLSFGAYGVQGLTISQTGKNNVADQVSVGGMKQEQHIVQIGNNNNNPTISLNAFNLSATTLDNPLTKLAFKFDNGSVGVVSLPMTQYSNQVLGSARMTVIGNNNNTYQFQEYTDLSTKGQNDASLCLTGNRNNVAQGQLGEFNNSDIDMLGSRNVISTSQNGEFNTIDIEVIGSSNVAGIQQSGDYNSAKVLQKGNDNFVKVVQNF
ncbi:MAG: hypothetical protein PHT07_04165 [Paludibacter sp.]|nr:hypothetical protein [Paludibacter sp.]